MKNFFKKFHYKLSKIKIDSKCLIPFLLLKAHHQRLFLRTEENHDLQNKNLKNKIEEVETKDLIRGEYENKIRAFSSIEKKFYLFSKKGEDGVRAMDSVNFFESLIPFPYSKVSSHDEIKVILEKNEIFKKFFKKIDINNDGKISFEEYLIFCVLLSIPIDYFYSFSQDKKTISRESFVDAIIKYIEESKVVEITNKSLFDGRQVKTDYDTFFINLTEFTGKAFKNMKINIEKEINDLKVGLNLSLLIYEFYRFPEAANNKISIINFGKVLISYINIYKKQSYLNDLKNISENFKGEEVSLNEFLSFFLYLDYLQDYLKNKNYLDETKVVKLENLYEIEEKFRKSVKNSIFQININKKHLQFMFNLLDIDRINNSKIDSHYLEYNEINDILKRRNALGKKNSDYVESGNNIYKFFSNGLEFLKSYLWFLK